MVIVSSLVADRSQLGAAHHKILAANEAQSGSELSEEYYLKSGGLWPDEAEGKGLQASGAVALFVDQAGADDGAHDPGDHRVAGHDSGGADALQQEPEANPEYTTNNREDDSLLHEFTLALK